MSLFFCAENLRDCVEAAKILRRHSKKLRAEATKRVGAVSPSVKLEVIGANLDITRATIEMASDWLEEKLGG